MTDNEAALKLAREIAERILSQPPTLNQSLSLTVALAAILEVTERAAGLAEGNRTDDDSMWDRAASSIATALRNLEHLT